MRFQPRKQGRKCVGVLDAFGQRIFSDSFAVGVLYNEFGCGTDTIDLPAEEGVACDTGIERIQRKLD